MEYCSIQVGRANMHFHSTARTKSFVMGFTSAEGEKASALNEWQIIFLSAKKI